MLDIQAAADSMRERLRYRELELSQSHMIVHLMALLEDLQALACVVNTPVRWRYKKASLDNSENLMCYGCLFGVNLDCPIDFGRRDVHEIYDIMMKAELMAELRVEIGEPELGYISVWQTQATQLLDVGYVGWVLTITFIVQPL